MADKITVLTICGSLRKSSFNKMALKVAESLAPSGMTIDHYSGMGDLPPYNDDVREKGYPPLVADFRARIKAADGILFATPEYNYSIPGVLKNAIDWGSRPPEQPFDGKPVAMLGASQGLFGTARAQYDLRKMCVFLNMFPLNRPEVMIAQAQNKFDAEGNLKDEQTKKFIGDLMVALQAWIARLKS